jgi:tRNA threonylcarbamoyladenosine biosynthesis protein TsaB
MIILGIETSSAVCGLAFSEAGPEEIKPIGQVGLNIPNAHSEKIMVLLDDLLKNAGLEKENINAIAISIGPGSFTGLRIGLSMAKGLAFGLQIPLVSVPTLDVIAEKVKFLKMPLIVATASRKNEYYCCSYFQGKRTSDVSVLSGEELINRINPDTALVCDSPAAIEGKLPLSLSGKIRIMDKAYADPDVFYVTTLGYQKLAAGETDSLDTLVPMYIQGFRGSKM